MFLVVCVEAYASQILAAASMVDLGKINLFFKLHAG